MVENPDFVTVTKFVTSHMDAFSTCGYRPTYGPWTFVGYPCFIHTMLEGSRIFSKYFQHFREKYEK
jgi:hypothetical protein